ncbi:hypothetical protein SEA_CECE_319 [Microbacterium phage Cece]|nr:hypothetical protein SEA_CECE_17 [Microbacterium phage Cece]UVG35325.1 hypothetical protein SEA_CECE_319 [Microbacterium phage Cece]
MKIRDAEGNVHDCPDGIDVNVWDSTVYGDGTDRGIVVTAYRMLTDEDGFTDTDMNAVVLSIDTDLPRELWGDDDWFGFSDDTAPGDFPHQILAILTPYLVS